ncbi:MAG: hypothetical protein E6Q97_16525 [Desulfurellales bacterium]|nr:MAG: hypothetical protein E6Q97_16525 [Desulfurellales bacterium]
MARLSLPTAQTQTATPTPTPTPPTPPTPGSPTVVGAPTTATTPTLPIAEVGIRAADMTADVQTPTAPVASSVPTETPAQEAVKITIENAESQAHMRIAQALQAELSTVRAAQQAAQVAAQQTAQLRSDVTAIAAKLREAVDIDTFWDKLKELAAAQQQANTLLRQDVETALSSINDALTARGIAAEIIKPKLTLQRVRRLNKPAAIDGDAVVIYYNPRQAGDGGMVQDDVEVRLKPDVVRNVHVGYKLNIPAGYVCDVSYGSDVVASYRGRGEQELVLPLRARPAFGALLSAGQELCRLTLRKAAALDLVVVE